MYFRMWYAFLNGYHIMDAYLIVLTTSYIIDSGVSTENILLHRNGVYFIFKSTEYILLCCNGVSTLHSKELI